MLRRLGLCIAAGFLALAGTGCVDSVMTVVVNPDGSGEIIQETLMTPQAIAMMQGFGGGAEGGAAKDIYDEAQFKAMVPGLGKGVSFKSGKEVVKPNGAKGARVVFAFEDITQLNLSPDLGPSAGGEDKGGDKSDPITFSFKKGASPVLTVKMPPKPEGGDDAPAAADEADAPEDPQAEAMMAMMKPMMEGMRIRMLLKVNGEIKKTDASFVTEEDSDKVVTLIDMQIGKLITDPAKFKALTKAQNVKDPNKQLELLKKYPEIKLEVKDSIDIHFK